VDEQTVLVRKTDTVLEELIDSVLLKFRKHYPEQQVEVSIPDNFISIPMDAMLIQQVLINLLENAIFHAKGMERLRLTVYTENAHAVFEVADDGCGIPREKLSILFTGQLYGTATPTDDRRNGMGIGLSVCAAIVRAHGGQITAENQKAGGALFRFRLELEESHE
jgi:two-component system sensor histidine kinase KdpD